MSADPNIGRKDPAGIDWTAAGPRPPAMWESDSIMCPACGRPLNDGSHSFNSCAVTRFVQDESVRAYERFCVVFRDYEKAAEAFATAERLGDITDATALADGRARQTVYDLVRKMAAVVEASNEYRLATAALESVPTREDFYGVRFAQEGHEAAFAAAHTIASNAYRKMTWCLDDLGRA